MATDFGPVASVGNSLYSYKTLTGSDGHGGVIQTRCIDFGNKIGSLNRDTDLYRLRFLDARPHHWGRLTGLGDSLDLI